MSIWLVKFPANQLHHKNTPEQKLCPGDKICINILRNDYFNNNIYYICKYFDLFHTLYIYMHIYTKVRLKQLVEIKKKSFNIKIIIIFFLHNAFCKLLR